MLPFCVCFGQGPDGAGRPHKLRKADGLRPLLEVCDPSAVCAGQIITSYRSQNIVQLSYDALMLCLFYGYKIYTIVYILLNG